VSGKESVIAENLAYILKKPISAVKFKYYLDLIGLCGTWEMFGGGNQRKVQVL
jgi:hypothetical protein